MDAAGYLASRVLQEKQPVTYRVLSRVLGVHVNRAKQELWDFVQKNQGKAHATYLVAGYKGLAVERHTQDSLDTDTDMKTVASVSSETVPAQTFELVQEDDLEERKATFDRITSIHIYSVQPGALKTEALSLLVTINNALYTDPKLVKTWKDSDNGAKFGVIQQHGRKSFPKIDVTAPAIASKPAASTSKNSALNASTKRKAEPEEPKKATSSKLKPQPAGKDKSKSPQPPVPAASTKPAVKKEPVKVEDNDFDYSMMDIDDEEAEMIASMKTYEDQSGADKGKEKEESKPSVPPKEKKRVKKTRKVFQTIKDEKGYKKREEVEEEYWATESDSDDKKPVVSSNKTQVKPASTSTAPKKTSTTGSSSTNAKSAPKKKLAGKPGEQTSMRSFFKKA